MSLSAFDPKRTATGRAERLRSADLALGLPETISRIILAANVIALFRVDREWTEKFLVPNFDWAANHNEAVAAWSGFLWAPRLYVPLLSAIKFHFLNTAENYESLARHGGQYANFLTYAALETTELFTKKELALATSHLPPAGLARCAQTLVQALDRRGKSEQSTGIIAFNPIFERSGPNPLTLSVNRFRTHSHGFVLRPATAFRRSVVEVKFWLRGLDHGDVTLHEFRKTNLAQQFPDAALTFLDAIVSENNFHFPDDLRACFREIRAANPSVKNDVRFERLERYMRQRGG